MKVPPRLIEPSVVRHVRATDPAAAATDAGPPPNPRPEPGPSPSSSTRAPLGLPHGLTLDPQRAPVPFARIAQVLARTSAHAHLKVVDRDTLHKIEAGACTFVELYRAIARGHFAGPSGDGAKQPISYRAFQKALCERGFEADWRALLASLSKTQLDAHMGGKLSPLDLFSAYAKDRASWRATVQPLSLEQVRGELTSEGRGHELELATRVMTPGQLARLEAGTLTAAQVDEILVDARSRQPDVIVVGAGMAGLAAAQELRAQGLSVVVLEASDVIGGRTKDAQVGGARFDAGAAWIHATDENPLTPIVKQRGFTMVAHDAALMGFGGKGAPLEEGKRVGEAIANAQADLEHAAQRGLDVPASQVFTNKNEWDVHARNTVSPLTMGVDANQTSTLDAGSAPAEEHGSESDHTPDQFIEEGWAAVVQSFAHGVPVRLRSPVTDIHRNGDGVVVEAGGVSYRAPKLVMTASTGILASDKITWHPPLPEWKREAFQQTPMATFDKIALRFDKDVFTQRADGKSTQAGAFVYELSDDKAMDVLIRPMDKDVVVALVGGSYGDELRKKGQAYAVEQLLAKLERIYGADVRKHVTASTVTSWKDDPWAMGSFTASKPGYQRMRRKLAKPVDSTVFFGGEAMSERWNGMVPGAYLTGIDAAKGAASSLKADRLARAKAKARPAAQPSAAPAP